MLGLAALRCARVLERKARLHVDRREFRAHGRASRDAMTPARSEPDEKSVGTRILATVRSKAWLVVPANPRA